MHDVVIRNGTVIDGTGATRRQVDIAIDAGLITSLEPKAGRARRELNADGLLVTPGWVDIHTHYDGQATWDAASFNLHGEMLAHKENYVESKRTWLTHGAFRH